MHFTSVQMLRTIAHCYITSVVTVSLFSRSVGVSMKKSVVGSGFGVYTCSPSAAVRLL